jgi:sporulation protein YlmC with PRC-barrel domain
MYVGDLEAKEVVGKNGTLLGRSTNAIVDTATWKVNAIEVALDGEVAKELDVKKLFKSTTIPLQVGDIDAVGDKILLKTDKQELAPRIISAATQ